MPFADVVKKSAPAFKKIEATTRVLDNVLKLWRREDKEKSPPGLDTWFRASSVHNICPREYALRIVKGIPSSRKIDPNTLWFFGTGSAYHDLMQQKILKSIAQVYQGWWQKDSFAGNFPKKCKDGSVDLVKYGTRRLKKGKKLKSGHVSHGWIPKPPGGGWKFYEMEGRIEEFRFSGHWDGVLVWEDYSEILELKTINKWGVKVVDPSVGGRPMKNHIVQANGYMWISGLGRARILYINKSEPGLKSAILEHIIYRDEKIIDDIKKLLSLTIGVIDGVVKAKTELDLISEGDVLHGQKKENLVKAMPGRCYECVRKTDKRPKSCKMKRWCFDRSLLA